MGEAILILLFALAGLAVASGLGILRGAWALVEALVGFIRHEMLMRPKERYYRM